MDSPASLIAAAVHRERQRAGLSLSALAGRAALAKSTLSQLEAGKGNPSIETLWAIATALGIPFSHLFETAAPEATLIRADEGVSLSADAAPLTAVLLDGCPPGRRRDLYRLDFQTGASRTADPHPPGTIEHAIVCAGRLRVGPAGQTEDLAPGDYYRYAGDMPHVYTALSDRATLLLVMETPL